MNKTFVLLAVFIVLLAAAFAVLGSDLLKPPVRNMEQTIADDRIPR